MRLLFVHQNFPGQFLHMVRHLAADPAHELLFITEANANLIRPSENSKPDSLTVSRGV